MNISIKIEKKHVYGLTVLILLVGGILFVQAQGGGVPNPGHADSSIYISEFQKTLKQAIHDGDIGGPRPRKSIFYKYNSGEVNGQYAEANCWGGLEDMALPDRKAIGGGCEFWSSDTEAKQNMPMEGDKWACRQVGHSYEGKIWTKAYIICVEVE